MASKGMMTGMQGVYLVAAELTKRGKIVSPTSRNAIGADLLVTDHQCRHAWSVQVKTNSKPAGFWLLNENSGKIDSDSHVYVFVNLRPKDERPEFYVVPSRTVARKMTTSHARTGSVWHEFDRRDALAFREFWDAFDKPGAEPPTG